MENYDYAMEHIVSRHYLALIDFRIDTIRFVAPKSKKCFWNSFAWGQDSVMTPKYPELLHFQLYMRYIMV